MRFFKQGLLHTFWSSYEQVLNLSIKLNILQFVFKFNILLSIKMNRDSIKLLLQYD